MLYWRIKASLGVSELSHRGWVMHNYMDQLTMPSVAQITVWYLSDAEPFPEPIMAYWTDPLATNVCRFWIEKDCRFQTGISISNYRLQNIGHFVLWQYWCPNYKPHWLGSLYQATFRTGQSSWLSEIEATDYRSRDIQPGHWSICNFAEILWFIYLFIMIRLRYVSRHA